MDIKIAQQETITELVLENQKLKQERDEAREALGEILKLSEDIHDETLNAWKVEFHKILEDAK
jgi:hypothetical protein